MWFYTQKKGLSDLETTMLRKVYYLYFEIYKQFTILLM